MQLAAEQESSPISDGVRARIGHKAREGWALPQVAGLALELAKIVRAFEIMSLTSAPGRIRTCAHGSGGRCSLP